MAEIRKLSTEVINQIAAGEVVERPSSVLKELIENAIDSGTTTIDVFLTDGGLKLIEVRDNGKGITQSDLPAALERYATSKIENVDDLQEVSTYGFRGEALAAIAAVSRTTIVSRRKDSEAYGISCEGGAATNPIPASRGVGTTVSVNDIFYNVPARQKFLKSEDTEYRYLLEMFQYFALINGKTAFSLTHNGKPIYSLPATQQEHFPIERVATFFKLDKAQLIPFIHEEYGIKVAGVLVHPKYLGTMSKFIKLFVNNRPIEDKGFVRAAQMGLTGYIPENFKVSGVWGVFVSPDQVDVNVHPRKMEVKFLNPFRVYSAVTNAVKGALVAQVNSEVTQRAPIATHPSGQSTSQTPSDSSYTSFSNSWNRAEQQAVDRLRRPQQSFFGQQEISYYEEKVRDEFTNSPTSNEFSLPEFTLNQAKETLADAQILPILGRYIIVSFSDEVWIIDQHAAAERVRFEKLKKAYLEGAQVETQQIMLPVTIELTESEKLIVAKQLGVFQKFGFTVSTTGSTIAVTSVSTFLQNGDIEQIVKDLILEMVEHDDLFLTPTIGDFATEKDMSLVVATMACHNSVRMNQHITTPEAKSIVSDLLQCKIPYACPHGRRIIWRLKKEEIDRQFMRT